MIDWPREKLSWVVPLLVDMVVYVILFVVSLIPCKLQISVTPRIDQVDLFDGRQVNARTDPLG
ncbi:MAG: hypothetical protein AB8B91_21665 [Rubripirellula sp.]